MVCGVRSVVCAVCGGVFGAWCGLCGAWCVVRGVWCGVVWCVLTVLVGLHYFFCGIFRKVGLRRENDK